MYLLDQLLAKAIRTASISAKIKCPNCGQMLKEIEGASRACVHCDYSAETGITSNSQHTLLQRVSTYHDTALVRQMSANTFIPHTKLTSVSVLTVLLATFIYLLVLAMIGGGLYIASTYSIPIGMAIFAIGVSSCIHRFEPHPPQVVQVDSDEFPAINTVVANISNELGIRTPDILLTERYEATLGFIGWQRHPILLLGHPFLSLLDSAELVGLLAHELAHSRDGAVSRSLYVHIAYRIVMRWCGILSMPEQPSEQAYLNNVFIVSGRTVLHIIAGPLRGLLHLFTVLKRCDSQRAEYVADYLSMQITGNIGTNSLLRKSLYGHIPPLQEAYERAPMRLKTVAIQTQLKQLPIDKLDRFWHRVCSQPADLFSTHPTMAARAQFAASQPTHAPSYTLSDHIFAQITGELIKWPATIRQREIETLAQFEQADRDTTEEMELAIMASYGNPDEPDAAEETEVDDADIIENENVNDETLS